jgi:hypothetical protein
MKFQIKGSCYCHNVTFTAELSQPPESYHPRACDCDFCRKQGAAYLSDPQGSLILHVDETPWLRKYRQGEKVAEFLICIHCGVLVAVVHATPEGTFGAINVRAVDGQVVFGEPVTVSPKKLNATEKMKRWQEVWFKNVQVLTTVALMPPL